MEIDKAIELTNKVLTTFDYRLEETEKSAIKLLIEAGKVYKKSQEAGWYPPGYKLPGETVNK